MDPVTLKLLLMFVGAFLFGFALGYEYALYEQGGVVE